MAEDGGEIVLIIRQKLCAMNTLILSGVYIHVQYLSVCTYM